MNKVGMAIEELHRSESKLAGDLIRMADRHKADHEIFHVANDLARWSRQHVAALSRVGRRYDLQLEPDVDTDRGLLGAARQKTAQLLARRSEPGLLLLADLRHLYKDASGTSLDWELLAQAAQAKKDAELLSVAKHCHPETLRQARWADTKLKESSPQIMAS
ncbi:MAG TPA: hypothetical protein VF187_08775 [Gemmatimonadales bacterium]